MREKKPGTVVLACDPMGRIGTMGETIPGTCQLCGCTEADCRVCIERRAEPCSWVNADRTLCSACAVTVLEEAGNAFRVSADLMTQRPAPVRKKRRTQRRGPVRR